jgi:PTH2 family peptidyl-tRNA hydrolase
MYAIIRNDLEMSPGKIASQAGHAYVGAFSHADPITQAEYHKEMPLSPGTKVCLKAKNLVQLLRAEYELQQAGIPHFKVIDSGCQNFYGGKPIVTALGIGPVTKEQIRHITKRFELL